VQPQLVGQEPSLVTLAAGVRSAHDLLEGDHVGVDLAKHVGDPAGPHAAVEAFPAMDVVGDDAQAHPLRF
jgi:hypothetical protein